MMTKDEIYAIHKKFVKRGDDNKVHCNLCPYSIEEDYSCLASEVIKEYEEVWDDENENETI